MLLAFLPDIFPGFRVGRVDLHAVALIIIGLGGAAFGAHQQPALIHLVKVFAAPIHRRPDGDHHFDAHAVQLVHHGFGIRPVGLVKLPVALHRPMEEIDDDHVQLNAELMIFPGYLEHFLLGAVAQLALPEAHVVLPHHRRAAGDGGIIKEKLLGRIRHRNPVIHVFRGFRCPFGDVLAKHNLAHRGIVPQEPIAHAGHREGNGCLAVLLRQLQQTPLHIHVRLLVLPHAKYLFPVVAFKTDRQPVIAGRIGRPFAVDHLQAVAFLRDGAAVVAVIFPQDFLTVAVKCEYPSVIDHRGHTAVADRRQRRLIESAVPAAQGFFSHFDLGLRAFRRLGQRPCLVGPFRVHGGAHPQGILAPGFNAQRFPLALADKGAIFF